MDIVIGDWDGTSTGCTSCIAVRKDFLLATAFRNINSQVEIDFYDVYDDGVTLSITALPSLTCTTNIGAYNPGMVHMDLIAESGNTSITGRPFCNKLVVTWEDNLTGNIYADTTTLNNPHFTLTGTQINPAMTSGNLPDVAAIQRSGFGFPTPVHNIALITYAFGGTVNLVEWDYTANTISGVTQLDNGMGGGGAQPRIDAIDDFQVNGNAALTNYKVVAMANTGVRTYDNLLGAGANYAVSGVIDISTVPGYTSWLPPSYTDFFSPVVALGPNYCYEVAHSMRFGTADSNIIFMEPITRNSSTNLVSNKYYWVSSGNPNLYAIFGLGSTFAVAASSAVNAPQSASIFAWSHRDVLGNWLVDYKITTAGTGFAFKQGPTATAENTAHNWSVYPNPANGYITVSDAGSQSISYRILDVKGVEVSAGNVQGSSKLLNISTLATGTYMLQATANDGAEHRTLFVKE